jgi:hypothetical protein
MASRRTYSCYVCQRNGLDIQVFLDGKDEYGKTKYLESDGVTKHFHKTSKGNGEEESTTTVVTTAAEPTPMMMKIINAKLDRIITLLESQKK